MHIQLGILFKLYIISFFILKFFFIYKKKLPKFKKPSKILETMIKVLKDKEDFHNNFNVNLGKLNVLDRSDPK